MASVLMPAFRGIGPFRPKAWQNRRMRLTGRLSQPQRIVIVIAFGMALGVAGTYLVSIGQPEFGWVAYTPLSQTISSPHTGLAGWLRLLIWLLLICLWALGSIQVLRPSRDEPPLR
jgi:hypothetical protein